VPPIWYFDFISPFALPAIAARACALPGAGPSSRARSCSARCWHITGNLVLREIKGKREFTYRMVQWTADASGVELKFPPAHPFNPIAALRLCIAAGSGWQAVDAIFAHIWKHGLAGDSAESPGGVVCTPGYRQH
jgi:2-hydroxychromene-2-carboxylate isomerase